MPSTETRWRELPPLKPPYRGHKSGNDRLKKVKQAKRQYEKRKTVGLCAYGGCPAKAGRGHAYCLAHLLRMSRRANERYEKRTNEALCIYCGLRPQFWGVRCVICRQRFATNPLPYGARRALRLYREAEDKCDREQVEVETRLAVRKLLAKGDVNGNHAKALRLYAGVDNGKWRTYGEVGKVMHISKERVRQLLRPSKIVLAQILGEGVPWRPVQRNLERDTDRSSPAEGEAVRCCDKPAGIIGKRESHSYDDLPAVILVDVSVYRCENCQTEVTLIPRQQELDKALAQRVLLKPASLAGKDLQFLRKTSRLTIEALSELLDVSSSTLSAWEASAALRHNNDLAVRVVIASIVDQVNGPRLIHKILESIRIGNVELDPILARWSEPEGEWSIDSAVK